MRMTADDLIPEMRGVTVRPLALAFLELVAWRSRMVTEMREQTGERSLTVLDANVLLYVFTFGLAGGGSRAQEIVETFTAPRRTIRDSLALLGRLGLVTQEGRLYYPTPAAAEIFNARFEDRYRRIAKVCDAFADYRRAIGR